MSLESLQDLSSVIDHKALLTRCLNRLDFAERMLTLFQGQCGEELAKLDQAFETGDVDAVRRLSHRMAGACANAAAFGMQACATDVRHAVDNGSLDKASQCRVELRQEWERFTAAMAAGHKQSSTGPF